MLKEKEKAITMVMTVLDVLVALTSFNLSVFVNSGRFSSDSPETLIIIQLLIVIFWVLLSVWLETNNLTRSRPYSMLLFNCLKLTLSGIMLLIISAWGLNLYYLGLDTFLLFGAFYIVISFSLKLLTYRVVKGKRRKGLNQVNVLLVGDHTLVPFIHQLLRYPEWGYRVSAIIGCGDIESSCPGIAPFLPEETDIETILRQKTIDEVVFCKEYMTPGQLESLVHVCSEVGVVFRMYSPIFNMLTSRTHLHYFGTRPFLTISSTPVNYLALRSKYFLDRFLSGLALVLLGPLFIAIAIVIKIDSKGPVMFKQKRVGLRGRKFIVFKFRTMIQNAENLRDNLLCHNEMDGPVFKMSNDPRITRVGKFLRKTSLDELPQLINVLLGEMSLVGPRPPLPQEVKKYERWQLRRLSMKPGLTCIWQVSGRNSIPFEEWMRMDLEYIDNWSLKLDFVLLLKTIRAILKMDGQ